jgi:serine/threonine protein kinase
VVGRGAFGKVRVVEKKDTHQLFALKYINKVQCVKMRAVRNILRERALLESIDNPFIVNLRFAFQDSEHMFMVFASTLIFNLLERFIFTYSLLIRFLISCGAAI